MLILGSQFLWIVGFFAYSLGCYFVDASVFSLGNNNNFFNFFFSTEDVNSWGRATHEQHKKWSTTTGNSNAFTVIVNSLQINIFKLFDYDLLVHVLSSNI